MGIDADLGVALLKHKWQHLHRFLTKGMFSSVLKIPINLKPYLLAKKLSTLGFGIISTAGTCSFKISWNRGKTGLSPF